MSYIKLDIFLSWQREEIHSPQHLGRHGRLLPRCVGKYLCAIATFVRIGSFYVSSLSCAVMFVGPRALFIFASFLGPYSWSSYWIYLSPQPMCGHPQAVPFHHSLQATGGSACYIQYLVIAEITCYGYNSLCQHKGTESAALTGPKGLTTNYDNACSGLCGSVQHAMCTPHIVVLASPVQFVEVELSILTYL